MIELYKLQNRIKHYEWGSPDIIPHLLGVPADGSPSAELWMGCHPGAPSQVSRPQASLAEIIAGNPRHYLGEKAAKQYGTLPFLFKLLAAEKPLSIQVHPNKEQAREGFNRENKAGLPLDAPNRNYKDPNHKPEIFCALTPFTGMCGFRNTGEIQRLLAAFLNPPSGGHPPPVLSESFIPLAQALAEPKPDAADSLRNFLKALFDIAPAARQALTEHILSANGTCGADGATGADGAYNDAVGAYNDAWALMRNFAYFYPGDPAVIAPLYLNVFKLEPGEAVFIKPGILHAYIKGFGMELMANSDNVLRGGLTGKHVEVEELMQGLDSNPMKPDIIKPTPGFSQFTYPVPCEEFTLTVIRNDADPLSPVPCPLSTFTGPSICIVTEGEAAIGDMVLKQGESAFIPPQNGKNLVLRGSFTLYAAAFPDEDTR